MKIDGSFFKEARKKIKQKSVGKELVRGKARIGTQAWVANEAHVALRSVIKLEQGEATYETIRRVSKVLNIEDQGEYLIDTDNLQCNADSYIDFRPEKDPSKDPTFSRSVMLMTLDPLSIINSSDRKTLFLLKKVTARLIGLEQEIPFSWFSEVSLTNGTQGWLGLIKPVDEFHIKAGNAALKVPIMFTQDIPSRVLWSDFVTMIENSNKAQFDVEIELKFARFSKTTNIHVSIDLLKILFQQGRDKHRSVWPHRAQLRTIV